MPNAVIVTKSSSLATGAQTMPSGIAVGDLLLAFAFLQGTAITASTGWTQVWNVSNGVNNSLACFARIADGGANDTITWTGTGEFCSSILRVSPHGVTNIGTDLKSATVVGGSTTADPPSLNAGSSLAWLWLAVAGGRTGISGVVFTAVPTNYTSQSVQNSAGATAAGLAVASRQLTATTEDPGTFTNTSANWTAGTLAIPPGPDIMIIDGAMTGLDGTFVAFSDIPINEYLQINGDMSGLNGSLVATSVHPPIHPPRVYVWLYDMLGFKRNVLD